MELSFGGTFSRVFVDFKYDERAKSQQKMTENVQKFE